MFRLERPNMAVNDKRVCAPDGRFRRFQMENTWDVPASETRAHIIEWVAAVARGARGGKLKHLVLSGHGSPGGIDVGEGFDSTHMRLFRDWAGLIEKIWLPNCRVAYIPTAAEAAAGMRDGNVFCSELAKTVGCHVVAATELQCEFPVDVPSDMMTSFEGLVLSYGPAGNVTWSSRNPSMWLRTNPTTGAQQCVPVPD